MRIELRCILLAVVLAPAALGATTAAEDFAQSCVICHTIGGGRLAGPDLKDVTRRRDRAWLIRLITNPEAMQASGDPAFLELLKEYGGLLMTTPPNMTPARAESLLQWIEQESSLDKSRLTGSSLMDAPLTETEAQRGRSLFQGSRWLEKGGPACLSCHAIGGLPGFGGGRLGPDLSGVFSRLGGSRSLAAWLTAPPTPVMRGLFDKRPLSPEEIRPLVAFLKQAAEVREPAHADGRLIFAISGLFGVAALLAGLDRRWRGRLGSRRTAPRKGDIDES